MTVRSAERDADGAIDQMRELLRHRRNMDVFVRDVLEERMKIDLLLVVTADSGAGGLPDDRDNRLMVQLRVVEAIEQMNRARAGRGQTDTDLASELRVCARHECGHFFVARLDESNAVAGPIERTEDPVDAIPGIPIDARDTPLGQARNNKITNGGRHMLLRNLNTHSLSLRRRASCRFSTYWRRADVKTVRGHRRC